MNRFAWCVASAIGLLFAALTCMAQEVSSGAMIRVGSAANEHGDLQTAEAVMSLDLDVSWNNAWTTSASVRIRADHEDHLEPGRPQQRERSDINRRWLLSNTADAELRELYVDGQIGPSLLRLGKQQIVWGQADGVRVLDVVNPFSYREFIWPDPQDRRIGLWSAKFDVPLGVASLQVVWLPDQTFDEIPTGEAAFAVTTPLLIPQRTRPVPVLPTSRPPEEINDSDFGARISAFVGGWDLTLNYLAHYYDDPVPFIALSSQGPAVAPRYERSQLTGLSFSNAFGSTTLRGEAGYSTNRWFITGDVTDRDRVFASDEVAFVIGVDNTTFTNTLISVQFYESNVRDPLHGMTRERTERQATLLLQRSFMNDSMKLRALTLRSLNRDDGAIQARLSWQLTEQWQVGFTVERFYGTRGGLFGEFRDASRAGLEVQWSWQRAP